MLVQPINPHSAHCGPASGAGWGTSSLASPLTSMSANHAKPFRQKSGSKSNPTRTARPAQPGSVRPWHQHDHHNPRQTPWPGDWSSISRQPPFDGGYEKFVRLIILLIVTAATVSGIISLLGPLATARLGIGALASRTYTWPARRRFCGISCRQQRSAAEPSAQLDRAVVARAVVIWRYSPVG
jgi:hypothetical protein